MEVDELVDKSRHRPLKESSSQTRQVWFCDSHRLFKVRKECNCLSPSHRLKGVEIGICQRNIHGMVGAAIFSASGVAVEDNTNHVCSLIRMQLLSFFTGMLPPVSGYRMADKALRTSGLRINVVKNGAVIDQVRTQLPIHRCDNLADVCGVVQCSNLLAEIVISNWPLQRETALHLDLTARPFAIPLFVWFRIQLFRIHLNRGKLNTTQ
jgi:hypothetical protein